MKRILDLTNEEAREHFLKGTSYFNGDIPGYISFEPILNDVRDILDGGNYRGFASSDPSDFSGVNYNFVANKDGRLAWRPFELINPSIYVSLVNEICDENNWSLINDRFSDFEGGSVKCCSAPVISLDEQKDVAKQIQSWWQLVEQRSLVYSLEYSHVLHTDVVDCYGSLYTHSIAWALHGLPYAKENKRDTSLLGNKIDSFIRACRYGQTNGISQGSVLMDFLAEIVLGYVDEQINHELNDYDDFRILRYRDDYRIFSNNDDQAEKILKIISDKLREIGMKLGVSKTHLSRNVVEGSIKQDKLSGIDLQDLGIEHAMTIQKQLLRLHSFGQRFPNSGALRRLLSEFYTTILEKQPDEPDDLEVQIAIATDIGYVSPSTFPAIAGIISYLLSLSKGEEKNRLWNKIRNKMARVPYNGYLEIWLQRITQPEELGITFTSDEAICRIINGEYVDIWDNDWISSNDLKAAMEVSKIVIDSGSDYKEVIQPKEIELFYLHSWDS